MAEARTAAFPSELIEVRADERLDERAVADYLRGKLPGSEQPLTVLQFAVGHANLTYLLRFGESPGGVEYVLRRPPLGPVAPTSHDMGREYRVLSTLWQVFPLAPRAFVLCEDASVIGAPFFVMERRRGVVVRGVVPPEFGSGKDPTVNRKLSEVVIDTLVDFHAADPKPAGLDTLGKPDGFLERQVRGWAERWERAKIEDNPLADELARWLLDHRPPSPPATLVHNDWRLDNLAVAPDDPGRCVAVYDWDMCTRGDPLADLGTLVSSWHDPGEEAAGPASMPVRTPGFMARNEAIRRYGERSGRDVTHVPYYLVFGTFKMAVVVQQIYVRFHRGQTQDARFAGMGAVANGMFRVADARRS